jgi:hypothetical protein
VADNKLLQTALQHRKCGQRGNPEGYKFEKLFLILVRSNMMHRKDNWPNTNY